MTAQNEFKKFMKEIKERDKKLENEIREFLENHGFEEDKISDDDFNLTEEDFKWLEKCLKKEIVENRGSSTLLTEKLLKNDKYHWDSISRADAFDL